MNLDPTRQDDGEDELSNVLRETEMWKTLSTVNLEKHIQDLGGLDVELQKDDERLDNRQKRLFCLARVLLEDRQASCPSFLVDPFLSCRFSLSMKEKTVKTATLLMRSTRLFKSTFNTKRSSP